jgi:hypothetical protein
VRRNSIGYGNGNGMVSPMSPRTVMSTNDINGPSSAPSQPRQMGVRV